METPREPPVKSPIWDRVNVRWFYIYLAIFIYFLVRFFVDMNETTGDLMWQLHVPNMAWPLILLGAAVFIHTFSNNIPLPPAEWLSSEEKRRLQECNRQRMSRQRRNWMIFAYAFMLGSLMVPAYVFYAHWTPPGVDYPISIFKGCSLDNDSKELACANAETQQASGDAKEASPAPSLYHSAWVLNLGGNVTNVGAGAGSGMKGNPTDKPTNDLKGDTQDKSKDNKTCLNGVCTVQGGLLVPLYVIILALMGGSISLTRRLPEYQKRANPEYISTAEESKLTQHEFREYLVFQIVQFISAPLIAILAYYLVDPSDTQTSVVLAFAAGFASETVLVMVRSMAEKITPTGKEVKYGSMVGVVVVQDDGGKTTPAVNAEVALSGSSEIHAFTDDTGFYVLGNVPIGEHSIQVTPAKDSGGIKAITGSVKIERSQQVVRKHWMLSCNGGVPKAGPVTAMDGRR